MNPRPEKCKNLVVELGREVLEAGHFCRSVDAVVDLLSSLNHVKHLQDYSYRQDTCPFVQFHGRVVVRGQDDGVFAVLEVLHRAIFFAESPADDFFFGPTHHL